MTVLYGGRRVRKPQERRIMTDVFVFVSARIRCQAIIDFFGKSHQSRESIFKPAGKISRSLI